VQFVPRPRNYFDERSHSGPWGYLQRVPLLVYGPGRIPPIGAVGRRVTLPDVAPTVAGHLGMPPGLVAGSPLPRVAPRGDDPPRLVVTLVWDGGGRIVLREHPEAWPTLRGLRSKGVWYTRATVGSSPSVSPAVHATMSTGLPPAEHGLVDMVVRHDGRMVKVQDDPGLLLRPTVADVHDRRLGNRPVAVLVAHPLVLGWLGHGSAFPGADRDLALIEGESGWIRPEGGANRFAFAPYLLPWRDAPETDVDPSATAGFAAFQTRTVAEVIRRERLGADPVPDLLLINDNQINEVGHHAGMHGPDMARAVRSGDRALARLVRLLDRAAGQGEWVLLVTADHGSTPDASESGSFRIDGRELSRDLRSAFDHDRDGTSAIAAVRVTQLWLRHGELSEEGFTPTDVARFLQAYAEADNRVGGGDAPVFSAVFPSQILTPAPARMCARWRSK
jgi:hypothetical protein